MLSLLPVELLGIIFSVAAPPPTHFDRVSFNIVNLVEFDHKGLLYLSHISSRLRQIVLSMPHLWSKIPTVYDVYTVTSSVYEKRLQLVNMFLQRSKQSPLSITIHEIKHKPCPIIAEVDFDEHLECLSLATSFLSTSRRWKSLILYFSGVVTLQMLQQSLTTLRRNSPPLPILDTLVMRQEKMCMSFISDPISVFLTAPKLRNVHFIGMDLQWIIRVPWKQLNSYRGAIHRTYEVNDLSSSPDLRQLTLTRNIQYIYPYDPTEVAHFEGLEQLTFENVTFLRHLPPYFSEGWCPNGSLLRWIEAPLLQTLSFHTYQALQEAPAIIYDLLMTLFHAPHQNLRRLVFHVGGTTRQSLLDLLLSIPLLEMLDIWDLSEDTLSILKYAPVDLKINAIDRRQTVVPLLQKLVIREWSGRDGEGLVEVCNSRASLQALEDGLHPMKSIEIIYHQSKDCLNAQDRIEGWDKERPLVYKPGSEYHAIHGFSTHLAKTFLERGMGKGKRNYTVCVYILLHHPVLTIFDISSQRKLDLAVR